MTFVRPGGQPETGLVVGGLVAPLDVAGYLVATDLSCRGRTMRDDRPSVLRRRLPGGQVVRHVRSTGALACARHPVVDPLDLHMALRANGCVRQDAKTSAMRFTPAEQIAYASSIATLEPGDLIATGTPAGTGTETGEFLAPGDVVEAEITGLGCQRNASGTQW